MNWKVLLQTILYELQPVRLNDCRYWLNWSILNFHQIRILVKDTYLWTASNFLPLLFDIFTWYHAWYFVVWSSGFYLMNRAEFGSLWIIMSLFVLLIYNLGDNKDGDMSAYSVFNKEFRNIMGALTADQFDREIRHHQPTDGDDIDDQDEDDDANNVVIDKRHLRRGKKARRGYEDKLIRRQQQHLMMMAAEDNQ